ncbi:MAG: membrane protein insertion efficiency factor YidD [Clostridia bacterium]|nr:membrane protein insertion efficiency factor YidD [Clostridia bacterium]
MAKSAVIWLVHLYQNKASDRTRLKCMFEPSCSEYMILAVEKYGVVRGVFKGIRRLLRCHPPNGGKDYP